MLNKLHHFLLIGLIIVSMEAGARFHSGLQGIPDTPDARKIIATLERAYDVLAIPFDTLGVNKLSEVFIDDPLFLDRLTPDQKEQAQARVSTILGAKAATSFGYLTALKAKRVQQQHGANLLKNAMNKARAANRDMTEEEWKTLAEQNYGEQPYLPDSSLPGRFPLEYLSIEIDNDKAYVRYDDGPAVQDAILVHVNGRWFVAGIIPIKVHF